MFKNTILKEFINLSIKNIKTPYCRNIDNKRIESYSDYRNIKVYASNVLE
ncbi:hypothetical protein SCAPIOD180001 [Staphylococcus capitis]|nr:hypothetical protein CR01_180001 [Staphylococcus capitis CR01]CQD26525.1 hypothetical protein SCAPIOD120072 [Staphylococcus capitis]CQD27460.1 hypothetical protein SCAPIOD180001 [Staphylococcus capitis]CQD31091.1 hypothetical protein SCAPIOD150004 [Staphylococcus capitis]CRN11131.1 hypothetical protein BN1517170001 [Staphylococcus capitis]